MHKIVLGVGLLPCIGSLIYYYVGPWYLWWDTSCNIAVLWMVYWYANVKCNKVGLVN